MSEFILPANDMRQRIVNSIFEHIAGLDKNKEFVITIERQSKGRSAAQNRLQQLWHMEAAQQLRDETAEEKRAYCKLHFGVKMLHSENAKFRAAWNKTMKPLGYETMLQLMQVPFDFPVTRLMTVEQKTRCLDAVWAHYTSQGVRLTNPADFGL
jgi:hypothetical protein